MQSNESALLDKARGYIQQGFAAEQEFQPTHLFIATWEDVGYYNRGDDKVLLKFNFVVYCICID